jgi:alpha-amylase
MGVLLQGFFFGPGRVAGAPSPLDDPKERKKALASPDAAAEANFWWNHLAKQANSLRHAGFSAIWIPSPLKGASGELSSGYDVFDDYDLGGKDQKGTIPTRYGTRELVERCVAVMRANGIDVYVDIIENDRDGDPGNFVFEYADALGNPQGGRFSKGPGDFHPHVPEDPGVFSDAFSFGRDLAPINSLPRHHCFDGLLNGGDWLARSLGIQGFRLDNTKGVSTDFMLPLLNHAALAGKFAVGEFADGNIGFIEQWANAMQHRASSFDFPLHFLLKTMCNNPDSMDMASLDHAGLAGVDPLGAVTFVENHDTDRGGIGGPIVRNKMLAYAYILTSEGYPCVFYRDYSTDKNCFGLEKDINDLIWIHEHLANGPTQQRWKDNGVFAFERLGTSNAPRHLLVGLNKDSDSFRTITVQTGFPGNTVLQDFAGHSQSIRTDAHGNVTLTIQKCTNGLGYVCYALPEPKTGFKVNTVVTTQDYEGANDLDIASANDGAQVQVCRVYADSNSTIDARLLFNPSGWTGNTRIDLEVHDPSGKVVAQKGFDHTASGDTVPFRAQAKGFYAFLVRSANTPGAVKDTPYTLRVSYSAPQTL